MAAGLFFFLAIFGSAAAIGVDVTTEYGKIKGVQEDNPKVTSFYGIPFASPPTHDLRFKSPIPPTPWTNVRECTHDSYFHICPQFHIEKNIVLGEEDCLYLNIYVPTTPPPPGGFPVMFWIYGGGYTIGDGYEFGFYRGKNLAAKHDVIVVEHNYRLGVLGLLALPELQKENAANSTGNMALQDQQAALAFVYRNIAQFTGNPKQITIFGESAGAFSVCWHYVSPISKQYISAAIMESGTCSASEFFVTLERAFLFSQEASSIIGCNGTDVVTCLRAKPVIDLFFKGALWPNPDTHIIPPLAPAMPFGPVIDGSPSGLLARPYELIKAGQSAKVPLLIGSNLNEGTVFLADVGKIVPGAHLPLSTANFNKTVLHFYNQSTADAISALYPLSSYKSNDARAAFMLRDFFFTCAARRVAETLSSQNVPVFLYQFTAKLTNWVDYLAFGDYHSLELPFVFDNQWPVGLHDFTPSEQSLSDLFTLYWTNLAKYGTPNGKLDGALAWPQYNSASKLNMVLEYPNSVNANLIAGICDFWDNHYPKYYFD